MISISSVVSTRIDSFLGVIDTLQFGGGCYKLGLVFVCIQQCGPFTIQVCEDCIPCIGRCCFQWVHITRNICSITTIGIVCLKSLRQVPSITGGLCISGSCICWPFCVNTFACMVISFVGNCNTTSRWYSSTSAAIPCA